jgi:hypothetical protein
MKIQMTLTAIVLMILAGSSVAEDWPQWQGPNRDGKSADTGLLKEWPKDGPPLAWRVDNLGGGDSATSIAAGRIFGMGNRGDEEVVWALSEKDGSEIWATPLGPTFAQRASQSKEGPGCTPTVDGERLYVVGLGGTVACLQVKDGKIIWQISMTEAFGGSVPRWSYRESPLIDGDKVVCTPGGEDAIIVRARVAAQRARWHWRTVDCTIAWKTVLWSLLSRARSNTLSAGVLNSRTAEGNQPGRTRSLPTVGSTSGIRMISSAMM